MYNNNKSQDFLYDPTKLAIHSILRPEADLYQTVVIFSRKRFVFEDIVHFIDEENSNVTYVDFECGITFHFEAPKKVGKIKKKISRPCEIPKCIKINDQHNCYFDDECTFTVFLNPYNLRDMDPAALKTLKYTNDWHHMSN